MSIQELLRQFKAFLIREDVLLSGLIIVVALTSYTLGVYRGGGFETSLHLEKAPETAGVGGGVKIDTGKQTEAEVPINESGYVASKNGTKYHLPWCAGAKQIKEENKIFFNTKEEAEAAGYSPASNCPGL